MGPDEAWTDASVEAFLVALKRRVAPAPTPTDPFGRLWDWASGGPARRAAEEAAERDARTLEAVREMNARVQKVADEVLSLGRLVAEFAEMAGATTGFAPAGVPFQCGSLGCESKARTDACIAKLAELLKGPEEEAAPEEPEEEAPAEEAEEPEDAEAPEERPEEPEVPVAAP